MSPALSTFKIIAITGYAASGKDTVAQYLREYMYGTSPSRLANLRFSAPLKQLAGSLFGWDVDRLGDQDYKSEPLDHYVVIAGRKLRTRREVLQILGTDVCRNLLGDNVWVNAAIRRAEELVQMGTPLVPTPDAFVCTDCRLQNEQDALWNTFGELRTVRLRVASEAGDTFHPTESDIDALFADRTYTIERGDHEHLRHVARVIAEEYLSDIYPHRDPERLSFSFGRDASSVGDHLEGPA